MRRAFSIVAIALSVSGCATLDADGSRATERILSEAGFQTKAPDAPDELARVNALMPRKIVRRERNGEAQYVYADPDVCKCVYTGTEQQYQEYRRLARQQTIVDETTLVNEQESDRGLGGLWP
jgi:hypothetical protein